MKLFQVNTMKHLMQQGLRLIAAKSNCSASSWLKLVQIGTLGATKLSVHF
jgi:hypothetical protein